MVMAWGGGSSFVPEYVVYQEAVQGAGRASMKHVSWMPTEVGSYDEIPLTDEISLMDDFVKIHHPKCRLYCNPIILSLSHPAVNL